MVEQLANLADEQAEHGVRTSVVVRSGAYVIHDDGFYAGISPLIPGRAERRYGRRCTAGRGQSPGERNSRCSTPASGIYRSARDYLCHNG